MDTSDSESRDTSDSEFEDLMGEGFQNATVMANMEIVEYFGSIRMTRQPVIRSNRGYEILLECLASDRRCMETCRMDSNCFRALVDVFRNRYGVDTTGCQISMEEQLLMTLDYFAHAGSMGTVATKYGHVKDTMSNVLLRMLPPLHQLFIDEITPPDQTRVHRKFNTTDIQKAFKGCIGCLDGTHVPMHPPEPERINWVGRPHIPTTNILAICDHDLLFTYFSAGAEGSFHDTRVLDTCRNEASYRFPNPLPGKFYLCDSGYVNKPGFMAPFRYRRYHPHEFNGGAPVDSEEFFNQVHSGLRSAIERTFGVWKNKWHIVHKGFSLVHFEVWKQLAIIDATTALHNFVRRRMSDIYLEPNEPPQDEGDDDDSIDLNRTPPPEALREEDWTGQREQISRDIYRSR